MIAHATQRVRVDADDEADAQQRQVALGRVRRMYDEAHRRGVPGFRLTAAICHRLAITKDQAHPPNLPTPILVELADLWPRGITRVEAFERHDELLRLRRTLPVMNLPCGLRAPARYQWRHDVVVELSPEAWRVVLIAGRGDRQGDRHTAGWGDLAAAAGTLIDDLGVLVRSGRDYLLTREGRAAFEAAERLLAWRRARYGQEATA